MLSCCAYSILPVFIGNQPVWTRNEQNQGVKWVWGKTYVLESYGQIRAQTRYVKNDKGLVTTLYPTKPCLWLFYSIREVGTSYKFVIMSSFVSSDFIHTSIPYTV